MERDAYVIALDAINVKVDAAIKVAGQRRSFVYYSAYKSDDNDVLQDNLDEIAVTGTVRLMGCRDEFYGGKLSQDYRSEGMTDPTWLQVCVAANEMIRVTRDQHHVFLEALGKAPKELQTEPGVTLYEFIIGS